MGPLRGGLILSLLAGPTWASTCAQINPIWDGVRISPLQEALHLFLSPIGLVLLAATLFAVRFRSQWGGLVAVLGWAGFATFVAMGGTEAQQAARLEGCIGSPALFIGVTLAICAGTVLYTAPLKAPPTGED